MPETVKKGGLVFSFSIFLILIFGKVYPQIARIAADYYWRQQIRPAEPDNGVVFTINPKIQPVAPKLPSDGG